MRDADPFALTDVPRRSTVRPESQRTGLTKIDPVQSAINLQGGARTPCAPRQVSRAVGPPRVRWPGFEWVAETGAAGRLPRQALQGRTMQVGRP